MRSGVGSLSDVELLAVQLGSGLAGRNAIDVAGELVARFGSMAGIASAGVAELARIPGIGPAKACRVVSAFALGARVAGPPGGRRIRSSADIAAVAGPMIGRARREELLVLVLDSAHRVRRVEPVARGGATRTALPVREVLAVVLAHDGVAFALAHNHPGGDPTPSDDDEVATARIVSAAREVGLRFLDHIVVAGDQWRSITALR